MKTLNSILALFLVIMSWLFSVKSSAQTTLTISDPDSVCVGEVSTYTLTPTIPGLIYNWNVSSEGSLLNGGQAAVIQWTDDGNATINVQGVDTAGTIIAQGSLNVLVSEIPQPFIIPQSYVNCTPDTIHRDDTECLQVCEGSTLTYEVNAVPGATYNWTVNGDIDMTPSGNSCTVEWGFSGFGTVSVEVVSGDCIGTDELCVEMIPAPQASFTTSPDDNLGEIEVCANTPIMFFDESTAAGDSPIVSWEWNFGDGSYHYEGISGTGTPVEHAYSVPDDYTVTLTVTNACGCTDTYSIDVEVTENQGIQIECPRMACEGEQITYTVNNPGCQQGQWAVDGGQIDSQTPQSVTVTWNDVDELGFGYITYNNGCGPCAGEIMQEIPIVTDNAAIQGPTTACPNEIYYYYMPQWPSTRIDWSVSGDAERVNTDWNSNYVIVQTDNSGSFTIDVTSCSSLLDCAGDTSLTVNIAPAAFIVGSEDVCLDDDSEYNLNNASTADWTLTDPAGATTTFTDEDSIEPTFDQPGTYTLEIAGEFCSPDLFHITVHPRPQPAIILGPDSACVGVPTEFSIANQQPGVTYSWGGFGAPNPAFGPNTNFTFYTLPAFYGVTSAITELPSCTTSVFDIMMSSAPSSVNISTNAPGNLQVCGSTQWEFDADYTDGDFYQWEVIDPTMGSIVSGNNTPHIEVLFNNPTGSSEEVDVILSMTKCSEVLKDTLTMTVVNIPTYTATPGDTTICAGEELTFTISPTPNDYSSLTWDFGDGNESTDINPTYAFPNNLSTAEFNPTVSIENPEGCINTAIVSAGPVEVLPAPVALISPVANIITCGAFSETLEATISTGFGSTTNYSWSGPTTSPSPPDCSTCDSWTINEPGVYFVEVENSNGCSAVSNEIEVIENCDSCPGPKPQLIASDSSFVSCGVSQANIQYSTNSLSILSETWIFPSEATDTSPVTGTNATATATFEEAGVYALSYVVNYGDGTCPIIFDQTVYVPFISDMRYTATCGSGSTYDVTLQDHSNIFPLEVGNMEHIYAYKEAADPDWTTIPGELSDLSVDINLPPGEYEFREIISSSESSAPACTTIISDVILPEKPDADFDIVSPFIPACINDVVVGFDNQSTPATGLSFLWDFDDESTNYQSSPNKVYSSDDNFDISLTATNAFGCVDSAESSIQIQENELWDGLDNPDILTSPAPPVCSGTSISLTYINLDQSAEDPSYFTWYQGNSPITPAIPSSTFDVTQSGNYMVIGSDEYGCLVPSDPININFTPIQTPIIMGSPNQCDSIGFTLTSSIADVGGLNLEWERSPGGVVGTGSTITELLPEGTYTYTLTTDQNGCEGESAPFTVVVSAPVDPPALSFDITSCEPYDVELTATNAQGGFYYWSHGETGGTAEAHMGGVFEVDFISNTGCVSNASIEVPNSPDEFLWFFPSGCFCLEDLRDPQTDTTSCAGDAFIDGGDIPFASWGYLLNGILVSSGTDSEVGGFMNFAADTINLVLDNGFCEITSDPMYVSDCSSSQSIQVPDSDELANQSESQSDLLDSNNATQEGPGLKLVPNPASNQTRIHFQFNPGAGQKTIEVYDLTGRKVVNVQVQNKVGLVHMPLGEFVSGIYLVCLRQDDQIIAQSKLSVNP